MQIPRTNSIQDGLFRDCSKMGGKKASPSFPPHTCSTVMKLDTVIPYRKMIQKHINYVRHPSIFYRKSATFVITRNTDIVFEWIISNFLNFFESLKVVLINLVAILMMSAKVATLGLLKVNIFWNKGYDIIFLSMTLPTKFYHVTQIIL